MPDYQATVQAARYRDLENRLVRHRAVEAVFRIGRGQNAHCDSLLLRDHIAAPILRLALQILGLYSRGTRNALQPAVRTYAFSETSLRKSGPGRGS